MKSSFATNQTHDRAFTLIELLVVIVIIGIILGISVPVLRAMTRGSKVESALNSITAASQAARGYATQSQANIHPTISGAYYSGVAMLFTPGNEIRLIENAQTMKYVPADGGGYVETDGRNAFSDIPDRDYIQLPRGSGVVGIARFSDDDINLITPPFAVYFNEKGNIQSMNEPDNLGAIADAGDALIYYDANYDKGVIKSASDGNFRDRPFQSGTYAPYNPDDWDPDSPSYVGFDDTSEKPGFHPDKLRYKLPFEEIESVLGIFVYNKLEFRDAFPGADALEATGSDNVVDESPGGPAEWIKANGTAVYFNRYTGSALRIYDE